jgi:hypothetical protein
MINLKYALEVLCYPDWIMGEMEWDGIPSNGHESKVGILKAPMLSFVFYTYLESEKISDDIFKCVAEVHQYISFEIRRLSLR